jgi:hypothetical protein
VDGNRIERLAVTFVERPQPRPSAADDASDDDLE